jgi:hypothetical protein
MAVNQVSSNSELPIQEIQKDLEKTSRNNTIKTVALAILSTAAAVVSYLIFTGVIVIASPWILLTSLIVSAVALLVFGAMGVYKVVQNVRYKDITQKAVSLIKDIEKIEKILKQNNAFFKQTKSVAINLISEIIHRKKDKDTLAKELTNFRIIFDRDYNLFLKDIPKTIDDARKFSDALANRFQLKIDEFINQNKIDGLQGLQELIKKQNDTIELIKRLDRLIKKINQTPQNPENEKYLLYIKNKAVIIKKDLEENDILLDVPMVHTINLEQHLRRLTFQPKILLEEIEGALKDLSNRDELIIKEVYDQIVTEKNAITVGLNTQPQTEEKYLIFLTNLIRLRNELKLLQLTPSIDLDKLNQQVDNYQDQIAKPLDDFLDGLRPNSNQPVWTKIPFGSDDNTVQANIKLGKEELIKQFEKDLARAGRRRLNGPSIGGCTLEQILEKMSMLSEVERLKHLAAFQQNMLSACCRSYLQKLPGKEYTLEEARFDEFVDSDPSQIFLVSTTNNCALALGNKKRLIDKDDQHIATITHYEFIDFRTGNLFYGFRAEFPQN